MQFNAYHRKNINLYTHVYILLILGAMGFSFENVDYMMAVLYLVAPKVDSFRLELIGENYLSVNNFNKHHHR